MKRLFFWGLVLVIFSVIGIDFAYAGRTHRRQPAQEEKSEKKRNMPSRKQVQQQLREQEEDLAAREDAEGDVGEDQEGDSEGISIEEYIESVESADEKAALQAAEYLYKTGNLEREGQWAAVFAAYQAIATKHNNPLAYFRLGELLEKNERLGAAYRHYDLALKKGFMTALPKILELGSQLASIVDGPGEMSEEVRRMFV